jgi:DNA-binding beta-propeller fold protein YncE
MAIAGCLFCTLLLGLVAGPVPAQAARTLLDTEVLQTSPGPPPIPPPEAEIEGACGLAVSSSGRIYVSDYHHNVVDLFSSSGNFEGQISAAAAAHVPEGPCGLAIDSSGKLYVNSWHESVTRLIPTAFTFDSGESTGVAVDGAGNVYVDDRTYVAKYEAPVEAGDEPVEKIGVGGSLGDGYGLAVFGGRVYVPDAMADTVKVYEPAVSLFNPVSTIAHGFVSLVDAAVAVDPTNGHLLVVDNAHPGYEHPKAKVYEFDSSGAFLGQLPGEPVDGEPSGIAVDPATGKLYVTDGNGELSNVYAYGPFTESAGLASPPSGGAPGSSPAGTSVSALGAPAGSNPPRGTTASASDVVQRGPVRVSFDGKITPHALPRHGTAPVGIAVETKIAAVSGGTPPQLRRIAIAINRNGHFTSQGLPVCRLRDIQPSTTGGALAACASSLVGEGHFSANVQLPEQSPFPSEGKVLVFNGRLRGKPALFAHIYGTQPVPTSNVLPFAIKGSHGTYGTILEASLPQATGNWGYVTGLQMTLRRRFSYRGKARSFLSAGCPAPAGFPGAVFPLARTSFAFAGGMTLVSVLSQSCKAKG